MNSIIIHSSIENVDSFGGKTNGLLQLINAGLAVPAFYVIPFKLLKEIEYKQSTIDGVLQQWQDKYKIKPSQTFSVRSSASVEDGALKSFAGLFSTVLNCGVNDLKKAIVEVTSGFKNSLLFDNLDFEYHIIIQQMIYADFSGVAFSRNPANSLDHAVLINIVPGSGSTLVSGEQTGMTIKYDNKKINFLFAQNNYWGHNSRTKQAIIANHDDLKNKVFPFVSKIATQLKKLEKRQQLPVDVEFCVENGKLYWLQMRPITALSEALFYDNTGISENYPGVSMPLTISFVKQSYYLGYLGMMQFLNPDKQFIAANKVLLGNMVGGINGVLFYNITSWQKLLYQLPFGKFSSKAITRLLGMPDSVFEKPGYKPSAIEFLKVLITIFLALLRFKSHKNNFLSQFSAILNSEKDKKHSEMSYQELVSLNAAVQKNILKHWIAPMLNGFFTLLFYSALKKSVENSKIKNTNPNFTNDILFAQGDVISVKIVQNLRGIIVAIHADKTLLNLFRNEKIIYIKEKLQFENQKLYNQIVLHIDQYGDRSEEGELRMETINYREDPNLFWKMLQDDVQIDLPSKKQKNQQDFNYKKILKQHYPHHFLKRIYFNFLIKNTILRVKDRENFRFIRTQTFAIFRQIFRSIDAELLNKKLIDAKNDSLYLEYDEILNPDLSFRFREIISGRKVEYANFSKEEMPHRFVFQNNVFKPVAPPLAVIDGKNLKGIGCCSGIVKGEVMLVTPDNVRTQKWENKIAIAKNFEPGWISLFASARGLLSERGSLLSHTSILCRELQIPTIVGVANLLNTLKDGDFIEMDGSVGIINIILDEQKL